MNLPMYIYSFYVADSAGPATAGPQRPSGPAVFGPQVPEGGLGRAAGGRARPQAPGRPAPGGQGRRGGRQQGGRRQEG